MNPGNALEFTRHGRMSLLQSDTMSSLDCRARHMGHSPPPHPSYFSLMTYILSEKYKSESCFEHFSFVMDPIDAFPEHISTTVTPEKPDALEYASWQGQVRAGIIYHEPNENGVCSVL
ncbi:hypothetical protein TNCV_550081 [Trichonephila clavipes]|nr:hypothetical protein TNCV_550081 [Trichonephila clavipes]